MSSLPENPLNLDILLDWHTKAGEVVAAKEKELKEAQAIHQNLAALIEMAGWKAYAQMAAADVYASTHADQLSMIGLAVDCISTAKTPLPFAKVFEHVDSFKHFPDKDRAKKSLSAGLFKRKDVRSVPWHGDRGWWPSDKPVPATTFAILPAKLVAAAE